MDSDPIEDARAPLGDLHAAEVQAAAHPGAIKNEQEGCEPLEIQRERAAREAELIRIHLEAGKVPPGYEIYTREQVASGEWLS